MKRFIDVTLCLVALLILSPILTLIALLVILTSSGPVFYTQKRVGRGRKLFDLYKFRSMYTGSDKKGLLTIGHEDNRITKVGALLRKYKLDELPQILNILRGDMSIVGPRPEVEKYVNYYNESDLRILEVRPGLTDYASILFFDEDSLLASVDNPEQYYIKVIMPQKIRLNLDYISDIGLLTDFKVIIKTIWKIFR